MHEAIELDLDEDNELDFKVQIEGANNVPVKIRLVCENDAVSYMFNCVQTNTIDVVKFLIPAMKNKLEEGLYKSRIEVMLENKYFTPVQFDIKFKQPVKIVAESLQVSSKTPKLETKVTATQVIHKKPEVTSKQKTLKDMYKRKKL